MNGNELRAAFPALDSSKQQQAEGRGSAAAIVITGEET